MQNEGNVETEWKQKKIKKNKIKNIEKIVWNYLKNKSEKQREKKRIKIFVFFYGLQQKKKKRKRTHSFIQNEIIWNLI